MSVNASAGTALRILQVHNAYQQRGGEDAVVEAEEQLLRQHGHAVHRYQRHNDEVAQSGRWSLALEAVWSQRTLRDMQALFEQFRPDVVHVHNTLPLISPSVHWAARRAAIPIVQTLHNFRLICPQALLLREGRVCEDCVGHVPWRAIRHRCYRDSASQSGVVAATVQVHRLLGTWRHQVTRYIALNEFCRDKFIEGGLPAGRIAIKPNFVDLPPPPPGPRAGVLFVGRLSAEKGVAVLAEAMRQCATEMALRVAGHGPEEAPLKVAPRVQMLGGLVPDQVYREMASAAALVVPSIWYENFPRTIVEAFACGLPVIASRLGAMATIVEDGRTGLLFNPADPADLAAKIDWAHRHPEAMLQMGDAARRHFELTLSAEPNYRTLLGIYADARRALRAG